MNQMLALEGGGCGDGVVSSPAFRLRISRMWPDSCGLVAPHKPPPMLPGRSVGG